MDGNEPQQSQPILVDRKQTTQTNTPAQIGNAAFLCVLVCSVLTLIPATRPVGGLLLLIMAIPVLVGWVRARKLTDGSRGLTSANATICGLMVIVGLTLTPNPPPTTPATPAAAISQAAQPAPPPVALTAPSPIAPVLLPPQPEVIPAQTPALAPAPGKAAPPPLALVPAPAKAPPAPAKAPLAPAKVAPAPSNSASSSGSAACDGNSYTNVDGDCIHRPEAAPSAPSGASAQCGDGTYSFSVHRQGTCSRHGGVSKWL